MKSVLLICSLSCLAIVGIFLLLRFLPQTSLFPNHTLPKVTDLDNPDLFTNPDSLKSYVAAHGPAATIQKLNGLSNQYGDCHLPAHKVGRIAYSLYGSKAFSLCSSECQSGCYHGAAESFFRDHGTTNLKENLSIICDSKLNAFFSYQCFHGIGHGLTAWKDYDLPAALNDCDLLPPEGQGSCYTGVFMENIVGALSEKESLAQNDNDHVSKYLSDDPQYPCTIVADKYKSACYFYQTTRMMSLFNRDFSKISAECLKISYLYQNSCFQSLGRDIASNFTTNPQGSIAACDTAPDGPHRQDCLIGAVQNYFWDSSSQKLPLIFCHNLIDPQYKHSCYQTLADRGPQIMSSSQFVSFCQQFEAPYQSLCSPAPKN